MTSLTHKKALKLLSRYALPPNSLGYCGKDSATEKFKKCIGHNKCDGVDTEISHFIVLYPYLKTISTLANREIFDYQVAECFWLGNQIINEAKADHYELLLQNLQTQGVPQEFIADLREKQPKQFIPFHLFQVLHVGVGKSSGAVPFNLDSINNCMIRWGKVTKIIKKKLTASMNSLKIENGKYTFTQIPVTTMFDPLVLPNLKIGDTITMHWKIANKILTKKEENQLEFWSNKVLETLVY